MTTGLLAGAGCAAAIGCAAAAPAPVSATATANDVPPGTLQSIRANIWTGNPAKPRAYAVAFRDGRLTAVIAPDLRVRFDRDRMIELPRGAFVVPGLVDAHAHLVGLGLTLDALALRGDSLDAIAAKVREAHGKRAAGEWITGRGWDQNLWSPPAFPTTALLDGAAPGRPVWLRRVDGHAGWASATALARAGITTATRDPEGGRIIRDARGAPTGVLVDNAMSLMSKVLPDPGPAEIERAILAAQDHVLALGLTAVHEMGIDARVEAAYRKLDRAGKLRVRVYAMLADGPDVLTRLSKAPDPADPGKRFQLAGVKLYADGALGSRGAALLAPYSDEPSQSGLLVTSKEHIVEVTKAALRTGWQVAVHAIGDRGNRIVLDAFEAAMRAVPEARDPRLRVEHAQILDPADIPRFARLGVIASMQPTHATSDMPWVPTRLGPDRVAGAYAWKSIIDSGAHLCAGSDFPVELADPVLGLYAAITRQDAAGHPPGGWLPEQRLSPDETLRVFTMEAAYCARWEADLGVVRTGAVADFTVLDRDITKVPAVEVREARVLMTIVGGRVMYVAPE